YQDEIGFSHNTAVPLGRRRTRRNLSGVPLLSIFREPRLDRRRLHRWVGIVSVVADPRYGQQTICDGELGSESGRSATDTRSPRLRGPGSAGAGATGARKTISR